MDKRQLTESIDQLILEIGGVEAINKHGIGADGLIDHFVVSIRSGLSKVKHCVHDLISSFNASQQYQSILSAIEELKNVAAQLLWLNRNGFLAETQRQTINTRMQNTIGLLQQSIDTEYID